MSCLFSAFLFYFPLVVVEERNSLHACVTEYIYRSKKQKWTGFVYVCTLHRNQKQKKRPEIPRIPSQKHSYKLPLNLNRKQTRLQPINATQQQ